MWWVPGASSIATESSSVAVHAPPPMWLGAQDKNAGSSFISTSDGRWVAVDESSGSSTIVLVPLWCSTATAATAEVVSTRRPYRPTGGA